MNGLKLGWIVLVVVLITLIIVIAVGIYQLNSDGNPWDFGEVPKQLQPDGIFWIKNEILYC